MNPDITPMISIAGLNKALLLAALFNGAKCPGKKSSVLHIMTAKEANGILAREGMSFGCLRGRELQISLDGDMLDISRYEAVNGKGSAINAIDELKTVLSEASIKSRPEAGSKREKIEQLRNFRDNLRNLRELLSPCPSQLAILGREIAYKLPEDLSPESFCRCALAVIKYFEQGKSRFTQGLSGRRKEDYENLRNALPDIAKVVAEPKFADEFAEGVRIFLEGFRSARKKMGE